MKSLSLSSATPFALLLLLLLHNLSTFSQADLIDQTCKKTPNYNLCISTLRSNPKSSHADVKGLASIMVEAVLAKATETLGSIHELLKNNTDREQERALAYCAELYIPVVNTTIPQAIDALNRGRYGFVNYSLSDAGNQADACTKKLKPSSPIVEKNELVENLSRVAVAIIKQLQ